MPDQSWDQLLARFTPQTLGPAGGATAQPLPMPSHIQAPPESVIRAATPMERLNDRAVDAYEWLAKGVGTIPGLSLLGFDPAGMVRQAQDPSPSLVAPIPVLGKPGAMTGATTPAPKATPSVRAPKTATPAAIAQAVMAPGSFG